MPTSSVHIAPSMRARSIRGSWVTRSMTSTASLGQALAALLWDWDLTIYLLRLPEDLRRGRGRSGCCNCMTSFDFQLAESRMIIRHVEQQIGINMMMMLFVASIFANWPREISVLHRVQTRRCNVLSTMVRMRLWRRDAVTAAQEI